MSKSTRKGRSHTRLRLAKSLWFTPYGRLRRAMRIEKRRRDGQHTPLPPGLKTPWGVRDKSRDDG